MFLLAQTDTGVINGAVDRSHRVLVDTFTNFWNQAVDYTPRVVAMIIVLTLGYIVSRVVASLITTLCEKIGLQTAGERSGVTDSMQHVGIKRSVPAIVGTIVFWLLMCVFLMAGFNILGLETVSSAMNGVVAFIPKVLVATMVVVVGLLIATFLRGVIATSADRVGISYAEQLASGIYYVLALLVLTAAFQQLGIEFELLNYAILIAFGAVALAFGLSFGLGGREVVAGILAGYYVRQRLQAGDHVQVAGMEGTIREVGATSTVIETDEDGLLNRHSVPNTKMLNEAVR